MSKRAKEILSDPDKRKDFLEGLNNLHKSNKGSIDILIGENNFKLKFVNAWGDRRKNK